jgi:PAS domain S-box-containing protein
MAGQRTGVSRERGISQSSHQSAEDLCDDASSRLAAIVASSNDAIIGKTLSGVITSWNPAAERLYGYAEEEAIGRHITVIVPPDRQQELDELMVRVRSGER